MAMNGMVLPVMVGTLFISSKIHLIILINYNYIEICNCINIKINQFTLISLCDRILQLLIITDTSIYYIIQCTNDRKMSSDFC